MANTYHLVVAVPDKDPVKYAVDGEKVTLGRSPDNDIQILVREVSTSHCEFHQTESGYEITDVGSTNGTKVNGQAVKNGRIALSNDAEIMLGETIPAFFVVAEEGQTVDAAKIVEAYEARLEEQESSGPVVATLKPPGNQDVGVAPAKKAPTPPLAVPAAPAAKKAPALSPPPATKLATPAPAAKKIALPGVKPPVSTPLKPTMVESNEDVAAPTVKLAAKPPAVASPAAPAKPTPVTPAAPLQPPAAKKLTPPASKKLAPPPAAKKVPKLNLPDKE